MKTMSSSSSSLKYVLMSIIGCELCERLAFYSLQGNLTLFTRKDLQISTSVSAMEIAIWIGIMYAFAVVFGFIADKYLNRYRTILLCGIIYLLGLLFISIITFILDSSSNTPSYKLHIHIIFDVALLLVAIGAGGIKSNVGPLGADQIPAGLSRKSYWNWFYFAINIGSLIAFTFVSYIFQDVSFSVGYAIPTIALLAALCMFYISRNRYIIIPPSNSLENRQIRNSQENANSDKDMRIIRKLFVFCLLEVMYWMAYSMQSTLFLSQACQMNINLARFQIPIASLDLANILIILVLIPIVDRFVYPYFTNWTILQRIVTGLFFVVFGLICAAVVEMMRKRNISDFERSTCDTSLFVSNLSVLWQIPQYLLIGVAEVFVVISSYNFFFTEAPLYWKSMTYAFNYVAYALGSWLQTLLLVFVNYEWQWIRNDLNNSHLELYFILCAALLLLDIVVFILYAQRYEYVNITYPAKGTMVAMAEAVHDNEYGTDVDDENTALNAALNQTEHEHVNYDSCS